MRSSGKWKLVQIVVPFTINKNNLYENRISKYEEECKMADITVDTKGMACPMPIVKAKKALDSLAPGQTMEVLSTDKGSLNDFQAWVKQTKNELVSHEVENGVYKFLVKKS